MMSTNRPWRWLSEMTSGNPYSTHSIRWNGNAPMFNAGNSGVGR